MQTKTQLTTSKKGEIYALTLTVIEAWFPIFAFFTATALGGLHAYFYSLALSVVFLAVWWWIRKKQYEIKITAAYKDLALTSFFITALFVLTFIGLQYTSVNNVAILLFLQILFSYLFLSYKPEERLTIKQTFGALLMTIGALLILFPEEFKLQLGDALVLMAAMIAPIANLYQKRARTRVSSETILLVRSAIALPFLYILAITFEPSVSWSQLQSQWLWLLLTAFLAFFIGKILWVEAIHLLPITKVNALFAFAPLMTMILSYLFLNEVPTTEQVFGIVPILVGSYLITRNL